MKQKIFLSPPGVATAAGCDLQTFWRSLVCGNNAGLVRTKTFSEEIFFAGKICEKEFSKSTAAFPRVFRIEDLALSQIAKSVERAKKKYGPSRIAVCVGSCDNGSELSLAAHKEFLKSGKFPAGYFLEDQAADFPATFAKKKFGVFGPALVFATACSSSASAIAKAAEFILAGISDAAIAGGVDLASDVALTGFNALEAVSAQKTNPFSKNRAGLTLGEGAAFFVLAKDSEIFDFDFDCEIQNEKNSQNEFSGEREERQEERKNERGKAALSFPKIELLGAGESCDGNHMTAPLADGSGAAAAMQAALADAKLAAEKIDYVNLHGTGTKLNDAAEALAMQKCFGERAKILPCSSTKPLTGHTLGASSAVELAACYLAIANNAKKDFSQIKLPLHVFDGEADEKIPQLNLVAKNTKVNSPIKIAMSNSFGFGGCNVSLVIGSAD